MRIFEGDPLPVRNDVNQAGEEILILRYFRIESGAFPEFLRLSREDVWPYFEKIGSRVVGMWKVIHPPQIGGSAERSPGDGDEVYLLTRYASIEHWQATREFWKHGGNGPDAERAYEAHMRREELASESSFVVLQGQTATNNPYYMPGLDESYGLADTD